MSVQAATSPYPKLLSSRLQAGLTVLPVLAVGLLVRIYSQESLPLFTDEAIYLRWASDIWDQRTRSALLIPIASDGKQPLFMWVVAGALGVIQDPIAAGRMVSALAGCASLLGVYLLGSRLYNRDAGLLAALIYAFLPLATLHERMALVDPLLSALLLFGGIASVEAALAPSRSRQLLLSLAAGVLMAAALWTKASALLLAFVPVLSWVLLGRGRLPVVLSSLALCYLPFVLAAAGLMLAPRSTQMAVQIDGFLRPLLNGDIDILTAWATNVRRALLWPTSYVAGPGIFALLVGSFLRPVRSTLFLWCYSLVPLITFVLLGARIYSRYALPAAAPVSILIAVGLLAVAESISRKVSRRPQVNRLLLLGAAICVGWPWVAFNASLLSDPERAPLAPDDRYQYVANWPSGYGLQEAFSVVESTASSLGRPVILLTDPYFGLPRDAAWIRFRGNPSIHPRTEDAVVWGGATISEDWKVHRVMTFILVSDFRDNWERLEQNNPGLSLVGVFWKPGGDSYFRLYGVDFGAGLEETTPAAKRATGAN